MNDTPLLAYTILFICLTVDGYLLSFAFWLLHLCISVNTCILLYKYLFSILLDMFLGVELFSYVINLNVLKNSKPIYNVVALFSTPTCNYVRLFAHCHLMLVSVLFCCGCCCCFDHSYPCEYVFVVLI